MYKLVVLFAVLALSAAAPKPHAVLYSAPLVSSVVHPAVTSYSSHSSSVVHGSPVVYGSPVVPVVSVVHQPLVHSVPIAYSSPVHTVLV